MAELSHSQVEILDLTENLWIWRVRHPQWRPGVDWDQIVTSVCVQIGSERLLVDALLPPAAKPEVWSRLSRKPPSLAIVLKPDHVRDIDIIARLYNVRTFGPSLFWPEDVPKIKLEPVEPGDSLPGGAIALYDGRGKSETPVWLPQQRTIVFADALTEREGLLRVWNSRHHQERALPALRRLLDLPFERVIISHGEPVHDRAAFERALDREPWMGV